MKGGNRDVLELEINAFGSLRSEIHLIFLKEIQAQSTSKTHSVEMNSVAGIENLKEEIIPQDAPTERLQEENERVFDEVTEEAKANMFPLVTSP